MNGDIIQIFNYGNCKRDITFGDVIVDGVKRAMQCALKKVRGRWTTDFAICSMNKRYLREKFTKFKVIS